MKRFVVIGLGYFGRNVLEELLDMRVDVLVVDRSREVIDEYSERLRDAVVMDTISEANLRRVLPDAVDGVVIDLGEKIEASILATSHCAKIGLSPIVVKAETKEHAEILGLVGATKIVFPDREAAKRIAPLLYSPAFLNFIPVSGRLVIAELALPESFDGKTVTEVDVRRKYGLNLISVKNGSGEYDVITPERVFQPGDIALVSGTAETLESFASVAAKHTGGPIARTIGALRLRLGFERQK